MIRGRRTLLRGLGLVVLVSGHNVRGRTSGCDCCGKSFVIPPCDDTCAKDDKQDRKAASLLACGQG